MHKISKTPWSHGTYVVRSPVAEILLGSVSTQEPEWSGWALPRLGRRMAYPKAWEGTGGCPRLNFFQIQPVSKITWRVFLNCASLRVCLLRHNICSSSLWEHVRIRGARGLPGEARPPVFWSSALALQSVYSRNFPGLGTSVPGKALIGSGGIIGPPLGAIAVAKGVG